MDFFFFTLLQPHSLLAESEVNCLDPETFMKQIFQAQHFLLTIHMFFFFHPALCSRAKASTNEDKDWYRLYSKFIVLSQKKESSSGDTPR